MAQPQYVLYSTYQTYPHVVSSTNIPITYSNNVVVTRTAMACVNANYINGVVYPEDYDTYVMQNPAPEPTTAPTEEVAVSDVNYNTNEVSQQNGESSGKTNKSWASLFRNSKNTESVNGNGVNVKSSLNEAVNKENVVNNNEDPIRNPRKAKFIDPNCYRMGGNKKQNIKKSEVEINFLFRIFTKSYC